MREIVKIEHLYKSYYDHVVLKDMNITIYENDFVIINGVSGCGKSTLLNIIGLLDTKDKGNLELFEKEAPKPFSKQAEKLLRDKIGYLFQNFALVENETVQFNLEMIMNKKIKDKKERIRSALIQVNLKGYEEKKIYECSGGEQQRIAVARLLLKPCELILADEPTGSLDKENKTKIMNLLEELHKEGKTIIVVSHDEEMNGYASRIINI